MLEIQHRQIMVVNEWGLLQIYYDTRYMLQKIKLCNIYFPNTKII